VVKRAGLAFAASLAIASVAAVACRQVAGINPIVYSGNEGGAGGCSGGKLVISTTQQLDLLSVTGGFAFASVVSANGIGDVNIVDCATSSSCTQPKGLLNLSFSDTLEGYSPGAKIFYTVQNGTDAGTLHSMAYDGTGDQVVLGSLTHPAWVAVSGARTFWVDDDLTGLQATVHCVGCGPSDATWITNLTATAGIFADANDVYVLADDGTGQATIGLYGCSVQTACGATPRTVIKSLSPTSISPVTQFASDGTNVYVSNDATQIIRIDPTGAQLPVAKNVAGVAIAVDAVTGELFYGDDDGTVARVKTDGSSATPTTLSSCDPATPNEIYGLAIDDKNVYVLLVDTNLVSSVYAVPR
jgi:hypothetical protein